MKPSIVLSNPSEQYNTLLGEQGQSYEKRLCENIESGNYQETSSPLELWAGGIQEIAQHAQDSHIEAEFPKLAAPLPNGDGCRLWPRRSVRFIQGVAEFILSACAFTKKQYV